jgi:asparagine synthase (glutamine-hydrolysing)
MCGIFGVWATDRLDASVIESLIYKSWAQLAVRGPDGRGALFGETYGPLTVVMNEAENRCIASDLVFTHTRLSIIDLTNHGAQPMSDRSKKFWVTFNGEIYNYKTIREELKKEGVIFRSDSDTEVLIEAWAHWGTKILEKLTGMYAFAIWDVDSKALYLVRDRVGIKPLYYSNGDGLNICFASDQTTLIKSGAVKFKPNWEGVISGMMFQGALRPKTAYQGINEIPAGSYLRVTTEKLDLIQYWDLRKCDETLSAEADILAKARDLLVKSVRSTLISDVNVATLLSGGIDSSIITGMAAKEHPNISAYTLAWRDSLAGGSELSQASRFASKHGIDHHIEMLDDGEIADSFDVMLETFEEPMGVLEPHFPIADKLNKNNVKVVLEGLGPDEMLGGYGHYKFIKSWERLKNLRPFLKNVSIGNDRVNKLIQLCNSETAADAYVALFNGYLWGRPEKIFEEDIVPTGWNPVTTVKELYPRAWTDFKDPMQVFNYLDLKIYIGTHHNHTTDKFLMAKGIEGRFPYLEKDWLEFCFNLDSKYKMQNGIQKVLMKKLAVEFMDAKTINMPKIGFGIPEAEFVTNSKIKERIYGLINNLQKRGIVQNKEINNLFACKNINRKIARKLIYLASLEKWLEEA